MSWIPDCSSIKLTFIEGEEVAWWEKVQQGGNERLFLHTTLGRKWEILDNGNGLWDAVEVTDEL